VIWTLVLIAASFVAMEPITALTHRCIMHGVGRALHRSHHVNAVRGQARGAIGLARFEANDAYPVVFASIVMVGFAVGFNRAGWQWLVPVGIGVTLYGAAYALVHDGYTHRRFAAFGGRTFRPFDRLAAAHEQHHALGRAPYGMLLPVTWRAGRQPSGSRPSHVPSEA
jgi:beta-carotene 3-hydroxylase